MATFHNPSHITVANAHVAQYLKAMARMHSDLASLHTGNGGKSPKRMHQHLAFSYAKQMVAEEGKNSV